MARRRPHEQLGLTTVTDFTIESEIVIDAPIEVVWQTITEADRIALWWADRVELEAIPGGAGTLFFENDTGTHVAPLVVETVKPPTLFSFRWCHPEVDDPLPGNSMLVEFMLSLESDTQTRLRVVETDLTLLPWPDADKVAYAEDHRNGWTNFIARLATLLADSHGA
jgi:uncharacterized protein YndB with AHSA1/START domain